MANGGKTPSLGSTTINIEIEDDEIPVEVQVIDSKAEDLLLGNEIFRKMKAIIDYEKKRMIMKYNDKEFMIPIYFTKRRDNENKEAINSEIYSLNLNPTIYLAEMSKEENDEIKENLKIGEVNEEQRNAIERIIRKYKNVIALSKTKVGKTNIVKHQIDVEGNPPIAQKPYKAIGEKAKVIEDEVNKMLKDNVIRESRSPWASPVVIVIKKSGNPRFCIDYRKLNDITKTDAHPLPRIEEQLEKFRCGRWFSSLDLVSGFWQVEMEEADKEKTAFTCWKGLYEFNVMPFGLKNAPPTFQRLMNKVLDGYINKFVVVYIDDIMIYSKTFEEHIEHLEKVFQRLVEANLMVKFKKCKFCLQNIEFLGHIVGRDGLQVDPKKVEKMKKLPAPKNLKEVRGIMGLLGYYRKFVPNFSKIAKPINQLLKKEEEFKWTNKQQEALNILKKKMIEAPILGYPDNTKEYILMTDASGKGLGAVLSQKDEQNREVVIAYASKSLNKAEQNYPITEQECLAIRWAVEYFHKYLIEKPFIVITDHSALRTLMTTQKPKGRRARWIMELQQYNFKVIHRAGKSNANADALSRIQDESSESSEESDYSEDEVPEEVFE